MTIKNKRLELHEKLKSLPGIKKVYYQPPENLQIEYPAIVYSINDIYSRHADDVKYNNKIEYSITIIDKLPDNSAIDELLTWQLSSYNRHFVSDNLNHDIITLYY